MPDVETVTDHAALLSVHAGLDDGGELDGVGVLYAQVGNSSVSQPIHCWGEDEV